MVSGAQKVMSEFVLQKTRGEFTMFDGGGGDEMAVAGRGGSDLDDDILF
jgi:hypothetical protein